MRHIDQTSYMVVTSNGALTLVLFNCSTVGLVDCDDLTHILHDEIAGFDGRIRAQAKSSVAGPEDLKVVYYRSGREWKIGALFAGFTKFRRAEELHDPE